jgi:hypothetical protein
MDQESIRMRKHSSGKTKVDRNFAPGDDVIYIPTQAHGDKNHPDCEHGRVSSVNESYVFVKFNAKVARLGWEGTTAEACDPFSLAKRK